ncbi:MAG TPA: carboxypeptidase-like regulatory domain-containing protein, partial [Longimicrobiaceae bacterium]|nr:carboxypeptidase-like regulatory domain-containing protein [Longimicrobiaceae bacterium]
MGNQAPNRLANRLSIRIKQALMGVALLWRVLGASPAAAQSAEHIVGRVSGSDGSPVHDARVVVVRAGDRQALEAVTDSSGRYRVTFTPGAGDYLVHVTALGWEATRVRVTRQGSEQELVADVKLQPNAIVLAGVTATVARQPPPRGRDIGGEVAASEAMTEGVSAALAPEESGDLARIAATVPGVTLTGQGISAFGLANQTLVTLNGMAFSGAAVPRDARVRSRVAFSSYDPARGGFGAAQVDVELQPGSSFALRSAHITGNAPGIGAAPWDGGSRYGLVQAGAALEGPLRLGRSYYNVAIEGSRRAASPPSLFSASADALRRAGIAPDSLAPLGHALQELAIPVAGGAPALRTDEAVTVLARLDRRVGDQPRRTWSMLAYGDLRTAERLGSGLTASASAERERRTAAGQVQGLMSAFVGSSWLA